MATQASAQPMYTDDKAVRLVRVYSSILFMFFLVGWMHLTLLRPLKLEKAEMAHMDPSQIIEIPFPLQPLTVFAMFPTVIIMLFWLVKAPEKMTSNIISLTKLTLVTFALFGFCGSQIVFYYKHSFTTAIYIAALASTTWTGKSTSNMLEELPFYDHSNLLATSQLFGMLFVIIPFQVLSVLDNGAQIQRWPLPIILGGTYGYVGGTLVGITLGRFQSRAQQRRRQS